METLGNGLEALVWPLKLLWGLQKQVRKSTRVGEGQTSTTGECKHHKQVGLHETRRALEEGEDEGAVGLAHGMEKEGLALVTFGPGRAEDEGSSGRPAGTIATKHGCLLGLPSGPTYHRGSTRRSASASSAQRGAWRPSLLGQRTSKPRHHWGTTLGQYPTIG